MNSTFEVHMRRSVGGRIRIGTVELTEEHEAGRFRTEFKYHQAWLTDSQAFPIDPESLPLGPGKFTAVRFEPPLSFLNDVLPDSWGQALLSSELPKGKRSRANFLRLRSTRETIGAIQMVEAERFAAVRAHPHPANAVPLTRLLNAADRFECGWEVGPLDMLDLLRAGSTLGGARPKVLVTDETGSWIAKFPSRQLDGTFDITALEMASLDCASAAGLDVPEHKLIRVGSRRVLMVRRFDIEGSGRRHLVSLSVLCKETTSVGANSYDELAAAVRKHSAEPAMDLTRLFRQALFNGLFGNTDDHLKNFTMIRMEEGYRLAKAYDILPDWNRNSESHLFFRSEKRLGNPADIFVLAEKWDVRNADAIVAEVVAGVNQFRAAALKAELPQENITLIERDLERRLVRVGQKYQPV